MTTNKPRSTNSASFRVPSTEKLRSILLGRLTDVIDTKLHIPTKDFLKLWQQTSATLRGQLHESIWATEEWFK